MKRPRQHEIESRSRLQFEGSVPADWVVRRQDKDYGIDYEVEVFREGLSTGVLFKVQLKGTTRPSFSANSRVVRHQLDIDAATYLCEEVRMPTVFVLADLGSQRTWWHAVQTELDLRERLSAAASRQQRSVVLHISTHNALPETAYRLLDAVEQATISLSVSCVSDSSFSDFYSAMSAIGDLDDIAEGMRGKLSVLQARKLHVLWQEGRTVEAEDEVRAILADQSAPLEARLSALLYEEKIELGRLSLPDEHHRMAEIALQTAEKLIQASRDGPPDIRRFAAICYRAAEVQELALKDFSMYLTWLTEFNAPAVGGIDPIWRISLAQTRLATKQRLVRQYDRCLRLLWAALERGMLRIWPDAAARVASSVLVFIVRLKHDGLSHAYEMHKAILDDLLDRATRVAEALGQWEDVVALCLHPVWLHWRKSEDELEQRLEWARSKIEAIPSEAVRRHAVAEWEAQKASLMELRQTSAPVDDEHKIALAAQYYRDAARALGLDLENPTSEEERLVEIGLRDLNPDRVLRNCRHLFGHGARVSPIGAQLKLLTAGYKTLHCTLHGYSMTDLELDALWEGFKKRNCATCADRKPHPPAWRWSHAWQQQQNREHGPRFLGREPPEV